MNTKRYILSVTGRVQGVFFRVRTKEAAEQLGVNGIVRNESDGSVYIEAEADEQQLQQFLSWVKQGPSHARVDDVAVTEAPIKQENGFSIEY